MIPAQVGQAPLDTLQSTALEALAQAESFFTTFVRPWNFYQIGIALTLFLIAHLIAQVVSPRMREWMRSREGWPTWRLRMLLVLQRRLRMIFFVILIWHVIGIMQQVTWPSRSYLLIVIAKLASAWLGIALGTRLIRNPALRSLLRYGAWIWVTIWILGLSEETVAALDNVAIELGESRLSVWLILQGLLEIGRAHV